MNLSNPERKQYGDVDDKDFENVEMIYYLDKGIDRIEDVSEEEALELIDAYGTLLWEER